jgi:hypothetical protein
MDSYIYPNPVQNHLDWARLLASLEGRGMRGPFAANLVGMNGAVVAWTASQAEERVLIPEEVIGHLPSGLYVLLVVDYRGEWALFRFVKA